MRRLSCLSLVVVVGLGAASAVAQDRVTPAERVRREVAAARATGRLQRLAGEQLLRHEGATERIRITVGERGIVIEAESDDPGNLYGSRTETVSLSPDGAVTSMSSTFAGNAVHATVHGDRLHLVHSFQGEPLGEDQAHWSEDQLPALVTDVLWPLLVDDGMFTCRRPTLCPLGSDPQSGCSTSRWSRLNDTTHVANVAVGATRVATIEFGESDDCTSVLTRDGAGRVLGRRDTFGTEVREWRPDP